MKVLNSKVHGVIDYLVDLVFVFAPSVFGLSPFVATICYTVAGVHFLTSVCTQYELGLFKLIPFPLHGGIELVASIGLIFSPWILGFTAELDARDFFVASGAVIFLVWCLTDYRSASKVDVQKRAPEFEWRKAG